MSNVVDAWSKNIAQAEQIIQANSGPSLVIVVSGRKIDSQYWQAHFNRTRQDVIRADGKVQIVSVAEMERKGNFLGTLNGWAETKASLSQRGDRPPDLSLMSMVFGQGKRLSPFTQALGNKKPAFPTPRLGQQASTYLRMADLSNLFSNLIVNHLREVNFQGCMVKWGDEALVPGLDWPRMGVDFSGTDAVRFVFNAPIRDDWAQEKEWIVSDSRTGLMRAQLSRQPADELKRRVSSFDQRTHSVGVNLGSLAISYEFLELAAIFFSEELRNPSKWIDWDPYVWMALFCKDHEAWEAEIKYEEATGRSGLADLEGRCPEFYAKILTLREVMERKNGRPFTVVTLDFGQAFWTDFGLHISLRESLESLTKDSATGYITRELFGIPHARDARGNIIVRSQIAPSAKVQSSVIVDSIIADGNTTIENAVVIGGRHRYLSMPYGGSALFCAVDSLRLLGPHAIAFRSIGSEITLPVGGRHTSLLLPNRIIDMVSNESVLDYSGSNYLSPILGNEISFDEAGRVMSMDSGMDIDVRWNSLWRDWLS